MSDNARVLVVGTTPDYVDRIRRIRPGKGLFLTDPQVRKNAAEPPPMSDEEVLCPLNLEEARKALEKHLKARRMELAGIVCYDCESLVLAAELAEELDLDFPSSRAVANCRNKFQAKSLWAAAGLPTPGFCLAESPDQALALMAEHNPPWVVKPVDGSGSSLVFKMDSRADWAKTAAAAESFFARQGKDPQGAWPMLMEEIALGREFSADFLVVGGQARILRLTAKHGLNSGHFGITQAYELRDGLFSPKETAALEGLFAEAARAAGVKACICMVDFILNENGPWLLEMAPRPGGDCLPLLLRNAGGPDTMALAMDFAAKVPIHWKQKPLKPHVGMRIFAPHDGELEGLEPGGLLTDKRVLCFEPLRRIGDSIKLPPRDYDSWILANVIYRPDAGRDVALQNRDLTSLAEIRIKRP